VVVSSTFGSDTTSGVISFSANEGESNILSLTCKINVPRIFPFAVTSIS